MLIRLGCLAATATVALSGLALLPAGDAFADPDQDQRFLALLDQQRTPAVENVPELIGAAHRVCEKLDSGVSFNDERDYIVNHSYEKNPAEHRPPVDMVAIAGKFITAAVTVYCPQNQRELP